MTTPLKRGLSILLTVAIVISLAFIPGTVANAADVNLSFSNATVVKSDTDQIVTVTLSTTAAVNISTIGGTLTASSALNINWSSILAPDGGALIGSEYNQTNGKIDWSTDDTEDMDATDILTVSLTVPANTAAGDYQVTFAEIVLGYAYGTEQHTAPASMTATITVTDPTVVTDAEYELYYVVDKPTDNDGDNYADTYLPGDSVTVDVYIKANADAVLQAFDLYMTNDANLTYVSYAEADGATYFGTRIESGDDDHKSTATFQHIQAIGTTSRPISVTLPADTGVKIATLTFKVADTAVYNGRLPITITDASNIAAADTPDSYSPAIQTTGSTTLGVETLKTYTVTFDDNVADAEITVPSNETKEHNIDLQLPTDEPTRDGWTFKGWSTTAGATYSTDDDIVYAPGASYTANADVTLYALWSQNSYTVTWHYNGDNAADTVVETHYHYNDTPVYPDSEPAPVKVGTGTDADMFVYTFTGWDPDPSHTSPSGVSPVTDNAEYFAFFTSSPHPYTVTWKNFDGKNSTADEGYVYGDVPNYTGSVGKTDPDGVYEYSHTGWFDGTTQYNNGIDLPEVTADVTYTATFDESYKNYTITYDKGAHAAEGVEAPAAKTDAHIGVAYDLPDALTPANGYTFAGWNTKADGTGDDYAAGDPYTPTGTATLYAQYSENFYHVVYDANGGSGTLPADHSNVPYTQDITIGSGDGLTRDGYTFAGWNTKADGTGTPYSAGATVNKLTYTFGATITLYAQWTTAAYVITYDYNGGALAEGVTANPTAYDVEDLPITLNQPVKQGYDFDSWTITLTGTEGAVVTEGNQIKTGTWGNLTVKANWTPAEVNYTVKHWQQNLDNDEYTEVTTDAETKPGFTEDDTEAEAKTYTGFTAKPFSQETIAADGSTVVNIYYDRDTHTVTYSYTGTLIPEGADALLPAQATYKYGASYTVADAPAVTGYDFSGWSIAGEQTMGTADVSITGSWSEHVFTITFKNETGTALADQGPDNTFTISDPSITEPEIPAKAWYDAVAWTGYTTETLADQDATPTYTEHVYTITWMDGEDPVGTDTFTDTDRDVTVPTPIPTKDGYTSAWSAEPDTNTPSDQTITVVYTPINYTITFETAGGTAIPAMTYTIESTDNLPPATGKTNFRFTGWKVTTEDGNWAANAEFNAGTAVTGKYGDVTLTAQWEQSLSYKVVEYKYESAGYKLLLIDAAGAGEGNVYKFGEETMYYTTDATYQFATDAGTTTAAVFYTLVPVTGEDLILTDDQVGSIAAVAGDRDSLKITYSGDINGDGKVNIADANAVFQMLSQTTMGGYYSLDQVDIMHRLMADMDQTELGDCHASIKDVEAIVKIINGETT